MKSRSNESKRIRSMKSHIQLHWTKSIKIKMHRHNTNITPHGNNETKPREFTSFILLSNFRSFFIRQDVRFASRYSTVMPRRFYRGSPDTRLHLSSAHCFRASMIYDSVWAKGAFVGPRYDHLSRHNERIINMAERASAASPIRCLILIAFYSESPEGQNFTLVWFFDFVHCFCINLFTTLALREESIEEGSMFCDV
jgi:hypothetical protein